MLDPAIVNGAHKYIKVNALCVGASAFAPVPLKRCTTGSEFVDKIRFKLDLDLAVEVHHSGQMRNTLVWWIIMTKIRDIVLVDKKVLLDGPCAGGS